MVNASKRKQSSKPINAEKPIGQALWFLQKTNFKKQNWERKPIEFRDSCGLLLFFLDYGFKNSTIMIK